MDKILQQLTDKFADQLNCLLSQVLNSDAKYEEESRRETKEGRPQRALKLMNLKSNGKEGLPLVRACDDSVNPALFLRSSYTVELDKEDTYLQVATSTVGLWIDSIRKQKNPRPLIRVEYDREKRMYSSSHVHLHAHSSDLGWIYGSSGQKIRRLHDIHFPAGGRRFRPTIEDFLLFLDQEKIFTDWKEGYKDILMGSRLEWERLQARATTRRFPKEAAETLEVLGYQVIPPD